MNIAIFSRATIKHFSSGGVETQLKNLVEGLSEVGHEITVITTALPLQKKGVTTFFSDDKQLTEKSVKYYYIGDTTPGLFPLTFWETPFSILGFLKRGIPFEGNKNYFVESRKIFSKFNEDRPFDIIISQSTSARGVINSACEYNIPSMAIIHGAIKSEIKNRLRNNRTFFNWARFFGVDIPVWLWELYTSNRKFFSRIDKIVAVSNVLKKQFGKDHPLLKKKVEVIYNGVDSDKFRPANSKFERFTVLYVGRVDREKGIDILIKAAHKLSKDGLKFSMKIIGSGVQAHLKEFKLMVNQMDLDNVVEFVGSLSNEAVVNYYQKSHVFAFPTRRQEGHPMTLSEAFCCGLPVIATKNGGLKELIDDGKNGYLIENEDLDMLVDRIKYLYENGEVLKMFSKKARECGIQKFSRDAMVRNYEKVIKKISK